MSKIEWTGKTWNPIVGCSIVSPGCTNCYAMRMAYRLEAMSVAEETRTGGDPGPLEHYRGTTNLAKGKPVWTDEVRLAPEHILLQPLQWKKPQTIFVNSMGDLFHEDIPDEWIDAVFAVMALCPQHTFQVLTKRPERMRAYLSSPEAQGRISSRAMEEAPVGRDIGDVGLMMEIGSVFTTSFKLWPLPNVWLGVSAENQEQANARIPQLLATPAAVRFVSVEPMLGPVDLEELDDGERDGTHLHFNALSGLAHDGHDFVSGIFDQPDPRLDWVICGGESGRGKRPFDPDWARSLRNQCAAAGVPFFMKQIDKVQPIPADLMVREMPGQKASAA